ncbi:hypothetical protein [Streptomyces sp. 1222.5]|uniref:hypothetical protein n=1 Tax=Streptomyces sp. 1222.5 TaxID=1881026 RepID=UPI003D70D605
MTTATPFAYRKALAAIPMPATARLTAAQLRGAGCVWCAAELHGDTAIDLEQRYNRIVGVPGRWFPRGCSPCSLRAILAVCRTHPQTCEQCVDDPTLCEARRALRALALELRR